MNRSFKDFEHPVRLAALFAAGLLVFVIARAALVPPDFGKYGHYRAGAIDDAAARPLSYAGRARCTECHEDVVIAAAPAKHKVIGCETCHGALLKHADDPAVGYDPGVLRGVSDRGAADREPERSQGPGSRVPEDAQDSGSEAADGHGREGCTTTGSMERFAEMPIRDF
jgi:hypothetical protein